MKKVIFSAIAMIAFVGTSMANGIAEKEVEIITSKVFVLESVDSGTPVVGSGIKECVQVSAAVRNKANELKLAEEIVDELAWTALNACLDATRK